MRTTFEIKSIFGKVLFSYESENPTFKEAVELACSQGINLVGADMEGADMRGAYMRGAYMRGAYMRGADMRGAYMEGADMRGAYMRGANMEGADMEGADMEGADMRGADMRGADMRGAYMVGADMVGADMEGADMRGADMRGATLPIICRWSIGVKEDKILIGCKSKTIEEWDTFFSSSEEYTTRRGTPEFKNIEAAYRAYKAYYLTLNDLI